MASQAAKDAATKMRTLAKYLRRHPELEQVYGALGCYPRVCALGAMATALGDVNTYGTPRYPLRDAWLIQTEIMEANDSDRTDFDTFAHFVESCDFPTLADMLDSLTLPPDYEDTES